MIHAFNDRYDSLIQYYAWAGEYDTLGPGFMPWLRVKAVCMAESSMISSEVSHCGARGLMQLMPGACRDMGFSFDSMFNPEINIQAGIKYLLYMYSKYGEIQDQEERWRYAHGAYNAGRGNVNAAERLELLEDGSCQTWAEAIEHLREVTGEHAPETINYVARIEKFMEDFKIT